MKEVTARHLEVGSRVSWDKDPAKGGTVIEHTYNRCKVQWDDPADGEFSILWFSEMENIGLLLPNRKHAKGDVTDVTEARL